MSTAKLIITKEEYDQVIRQKYDQYTLFETPSYEIKTVQVKGKNIEIKLLLCFRNEITEVYVYRGFTNNNYFVLAKANNNDIIKLIGLAEKTNSILEKSMTHNELVMNFQAVGKLFLTCLKISFVFF